VANDRPGVQKNARIAVIGSGWAGCAAGVELATSGCQVTLFEAARTLGGRARQVELDGKTLDNGQHILLGAYRETLRLLKAVGIDRTRAFLTLPLQMRYPPGSGGMDFVASRLPAPLHLLAALLRTDGLAAADKMALARFSTSARWMGWQLDTDCSVTDLLERFDQTARLTQLMWRPLCLAALNTEPQRASANIFLNVLRDSLGAGRAASDMLLPRADLTALFPAAAARLIAARDGYVKTGAKVSALLQAQDGKWQLAMAGGAPDGDGDAPFDGVVIATSSGAAAQLLEGFLGSATQALVAQLQAFAPEPITTCYLQYAPDVTLAQPFFALVDDASAGTWGQFVFDRGQLDACQAGLLAVVVSASNAAAQLEQAALAQALATQLAAVFRSPALAAPAWFKVITEKRATFSCTPALARPVNASGIRGLVLAGDYTASDYPATLESAVRSGVSAAASLNPAKL
jgi:hydroxysqualene dehydroxylase